MSRCKSCNTDYEPRINKLNGQEESLCANCLAIALDSVYELDYDNQDPEDFLDGVDLYKEFIE